MKDKGASGREDGGLSALERERRINMIFDFGGKDGEVVWWRNHEPLDVFYGWEEISIPDELAEYWKTYSQNTKFGLTDKPGEILSLCEPKKILAMMMALKIIPSNAQRKDLLDFFVERMALAEWVCFTVYGSDALADMDNVPVSASLWWSKYIACPGGTFHNSVRRCGLLIRAGLLPKQFTKLDFLRFATERMHVSIALGCALLECVGRAIPWELTPEGMEAAEQMGLLNKEPDATETAAPSTEPIKPDIGGYYSIRELIQRNSIPDYKQASFEKAVRRWQKDNLLSDDFIKHDARSKNKAVFLFRESAGAIQDIIKKYQKSS